MAVFRQPYDEDYNPLDYATPVGYEIVQGDPEQTHINMLESSVTEQSFAGECDINNIVKSYDKTGLIPPSMERKPIYGDFTDPLTFQEAQNIVVAANEAFAALPAKVRERFANDPVKLMAFMEDDDNYDEAVKLGLVVKSSEAVSGPEAAPVAENVAEA